jgi:hypothetical protein
MRSTRYESYNDVIAEYSAAADGLLVMLLTMLPPPDEFSWPVVRIIILSGRGALGTAPIRIATLEFSRPKGRRAKPRTLRRTRRLFRRFGMGLNLTN